MGTGITLLLRGAGATTTVFGIPIALPAMLVGAAQLVTGFYRTIRGARQITEASEEPFVNTTKAQWALDIVLGIAPEFNGGLEDFLGGL
ncbi:hypothetical protein [Microbacterium sp. NPDC090003]|uniref:hypothetical protein n=1 Tax=Microbacterium sp. NPDC090003 TaxID=3364203 RepID=UPI0037F54ED7